jgi:hypothetical protein
LSPDPVNNLDRDLKVFQQYYDYYVFVKSSKSLNNIKLRKKDILKELAEEQFIKNYVLNKEIDYTKEQEVVKLINSYNSNK